jgi:ABC-type sugar transport system substrate-binding protein
MAAIVDFPFRDVGAAAVQQALAAVNGETVEETVSFESVLYTQDSFDDPQQAENLGAVDCPA